MPKESDSYYDQVDDFAENMEKIEKKINELPKGSKKIPALYEEKYQLYQKNHCLFVHCFA